MHQPLEQRLQELLVGVKSTPFTMIPTPFQVNEFLHYCDDHHHNVVLQKKKDEKIARAKAQEAQNQGLTFKPELNPRSIELLKQVY
jgi:hypothetical protein